MSRPTRALALGLLPLLLLTGLILVVAAGLKSYCLTDWQPGDQPKVCYNDIQTLWHLRDMDQHVAPYQGAVEHTVDAQGHEVIRLGAGQIEYPVVTGVFAWLSSLPVDSVNGFWIVSALALTPFAFLSVLPLYRIVGPRALLFALSPQLAAYAYLNWDLLPVAATAGALWAWHRQRYLLVGVLASVGACAKIYPGFLLLPFLIALLLDRRVADGARMVAAAAGTALALNVPFMVANFEGWYGPFAMQSRRVNDKTTNSIWYWLFDAHQTSIANLCAWAAVFALWGVLIRVGVQRRRSEGSFPALAVAGAMVAGYIAVGRVDSPQYGLWLVPFLVVLAVPWRWVAVFTVTDIWLWAQWSWLWGTPGWMGNAAMLARGLTVLALAFVLARSLEIKPTGSQGAGERRATTNNQPSSPQTSSGAATWRTPSMTSVASDEGTSARPGT
ncbi:hypothetical protein LWF15_29790 [Kineosporia rhizophila]|uniref:glycosyltransferase 87 family protein n=1 Tax=Kineosporia rhizophila TaxID=84633 RepID=UPI001E2DF67B|nr:hypothetical protein [Kineosporia rhizophila]